MADRLGAARSVGNALGQHAADTFWVLAGQVALPQPLFDAPPGGPFAASYPDASNCAGIVVRGSAIERLVGTEETPPPDTRVLDFRPHLLAPGTIDVHTHGAVGRSFSSTVPDDTSAICRYRATTGTTALLATITGAWDELLASLATVGRLHGPQPDGAAVLGIHVEGPFINPVLRGALGAETIRTPSVDDLHRLHDAAGGTIRMMTIAPELPGALDVIEAMTRLGIVPSIGHTDATYEQAVAAIEAGARKATHTFNAMRPLHHRDPGVIAAVLADERIVAELIADGVHVHPGALAVVLRAKGAGRTLVVSDAVPAAGLPPGEYGPPGPGRMRLDEAVAVLDDGTIAGSVTPLNGQLRVLRERVSVAASDLFVLASATPAALLGARTKGSLSPGANADFAIYDADLTCLATFIGGREVFRAPS